MLTPPTPAPAMPPQPARRITSRQNPLVARFRAAARGAAAGRETVIEGITLIEDAWRAGWPLDAVAFTDDALQVPAAARLCDAFGPAVAPVTVPSQVMDAISPVRTPSGAVALARVRPRSLEEAFAPAPALVVGAVDVQDPGNLGAIVRAAEAAGATGVVAAGASSDPFGWKALRGAMGSAFRLPVVRVPRVADLVRACRDAHVRIVAAALGGTPMETADFTGPLALLVGAEGTGLPPALLDAADVRVTIPMQPPVESLNVAVATGVILYEARRQRMGRGL